jgi:16S rRNA processing protein RimM
MEHVPPAPSAEPQRLVEIGRVSGPHGLRGALKLQVNDPETSALGVVKRVFLSFGGVEREYALTSAARVGRNRLAIQLQGVDNLRQAEELRGSVVSVALGDLPAPGPSEFYYAQALGCDVITPEGHELGRIEEIFFNGANDVWVVRGNREFLIPVIQDVVRAIDLERRLVTIEPIAGLLD